MDRMKRISLVTLLSLTVSALAAAQSGFGVDKVFSRFKDAGGCTMVEMHDATLYGYKLRVYKSLVYKSKGCEIAEMLKDDRQRAKKICEMVEDGRVKGGYYMMSSSADGMNRFILFNNASDKRGAVVYIEGKLSPGDIMRLCGSR